MNAQSRSSNLLALLLILLSASPLFAQKVRVERDKGMDFAKYKTYAWIPGTPAPTPMWDQLIVGTVDYELKRKGLERIEGSSAADLLVTYHAATSGTELRLNSHPGDPTYVMYGGMPMPGMTAWSTGSLTPSVAFYVRKGELTVHLFDRAEHKLVWVGSAKGEVGETSRKKIDQLNNTMAKMFEQ